MEKTNLALIQAWVRLCGMLKKSRFSAALPYNESIVMLQLYQAGEKPISIKEIINQTRMLKSQVNRTINALETKGLLERCPGFGDRRIGYVRIVKEKMEQVLQVQTSFSEIGQNISNIIGPDDTAHFIRIVNKLAHSGYHL